MRAGVSLLAAGLLAGCATGVPVERQVVVAGDRFAAVQGEAAFFVRTFLVPENNERREVLGATCTVISSLYQAELMTPSRLVVPNFGPQSPEISVSCTAGKFSGSGTVRIVTHWNQAPGAWGGGYWGGPGPYMGAGPVGWGGWGWGGPSIPVSDYPDLAVTLR